MRPLVFPLTAIPSARLEAEDTLPPFFMPMRLSSPVMPTGAGFGPPVVTPGLVPAIGIGAGFGPPVGLETPGVTWRGFTWRGLLAIGVGIDVGLTPGANLII
jgi:hypothetical protein